MGDKRTKTRRQTARTVPSARVRAPRAGAKATTSRGSTDTADDLAEAVKAIFDEHECNSSKPTLRSHSLHTSMTMHGAAVPLAAEGAGAVVPQDDSAVLSEQSSWHGAIASMPQGLAATYWGDADDEDVQVQIIGVHRGPATVPPGGRFERTIIVKSPPAGSGRFAATIRVREIAGGEWDVTARRADRTAAQVRPQRAVIATRPWQMAYGPAVRVWSWPTLIGAGTLLAIILQALLLARTGANVVAGVVLSLMGCVAGFVGAKAWYLALKRKHLRLIFSTGACIQGFLVVALGLLAIGGTATGIGAGTLLDAATPGLFLGMAIGRPGCFLTGCCAGRPTASRWGLWSSDRTIAVRRVPVQLWEAGAALGIAAATLAITLVTEIPVPGALFVGAMAAYTGVRQLLFPFRDDPHTRFGRYVTIAACTAVIAADVAVALLR